MMWCIMFSELLVRWVVLCSVIGMVVNGLNFSLVLQVGVWFCGKVMLSCQVVWLCGFLFVWGVILSVSCLLVCSMLIMFVLLCWLSVSIWVGIWLVVLMCWLFMVMIRLFGSSMLFVVEFGIMLFISVGCSQYCQFRFVSIGIWCLLKLVGSCDSGRRWVCCWFWVFSILICVFLWFIVVVVRVMLVLSVVMMLCLFICSIWLLVWRLVVWVMFVVWLMVVEQFW